MVNNNNNHEIPINDTSLAAYLVSEGFELLVIQYSAGKYNRQIGTYIFDASDPKIHDFIRSYRRAEAPGDIVRFEHARNNLIDRVKRGLP